MIQVLTIIQLIMENKLRHARVPVLENIESITYIDRVRLKTLLQ